MTGLALIQLEKLPQLPTGTVARTVVYLLHLVTPLVAVVLYVLHRRAGPEIQWKWGAAWGVGVGLLRCWSWASCTRRTHASGTPRAPSKARSISNPPRLARSGGKFIPAATLMMDDYCLKCHQDAYDGWFHSAHHFSSFNNPAYLFSVRETRKVSLERDGNTQAARWCAGCHDPVPFFSGEFDDPNYDDVNNPTAQAGITCTVCHAITNVNSTAATPPTPSRSPSTIRSPSATIPSCSGSTIRW